MVLALVHYNNTATVYFLSPDYKASYLVMYFTFTVAKVTNSRTHSLKILSTITACRCTNLQVLSIVQLWPTALHKLMHTSLYTTKHHADTQTRKLRGPR